MRISDWSSDVCSSDLHDDPIVVLVDDGLRVTELGQGRRGQSSIPGRRLHRRRQGVNLKATPDVAQFGRCGKSMEFRSLNRRLRLRSEEHTSELQSLMRISYAVFCLKKKTTTLIPS